MKKRDYLFLTVSAFALVACGGGGSSNTTTANSVTPALKSVTGTVPGTLIEALCKDGSYYKTNSIQNGTNKHPFELKIPENLECKFIMTTNENDPNKMAITPLKFKTANAIGTYLALEDDLDMGYVPLDMTPGVKAPLEISVNEKAVKVLELQNDPLDKDKDGIPNIYEDNDGDGKVNKYDEDDDNDGILDPQDSDYKNDKDADGIEDSYDKDDDNDGIEDNKDNYNNNQNSNQNSVSSYTPNEGRLLGSVGCAQCHGTNGVSKTSWDSIAGEGEFAKENFNEHPIMQAIADGYNQTEKNMIDSWLNSMPENENEGGENEKDEDDD